MQLDEESVETTGKRNAALVSLTGAVLVQMLSRMAVVAIWRERCHKVRGCAADCIDAGDPSMAA